MKLPRLMMSDWTDIDQLSYNGELLVCANGVDD
jgi:hypothetical protein